MNASHIQGRLWWVRRHAVLQAVTEKLLEEPVPTTQTEAEERLEGVEGVDYHTAHLIAESVMEIREG